MSEIIVPRGTGPTPSGPRKIVLVQFELPAAAAVLTCLAEMDALSHVRLEGMQSVDANPAFVQIVKLEKSLRMQGYDAIVRAIRGMDKASQ
jgi:hypothetical protein